MCGRFSQKHSWSEIAELYALTQPGPNLQPRYNIAPTGMIDAVRIDSGRRQLVRVRWGLVPSWWRKPIGEMGSTFNARAETVTEKPMYRTAFKRARCIVPVSGYFEWAAANKGKQPYYFSAGDGGVLSIAGLWDEWTDRASPAGPLLSCTLIVTAANTFVRPIHDRMPVLLQPKDFASWLDGSAGTELLVPAAENALQVWPVSKRVKPP
jgi:putative SOS response-associated peptidase YedK